MKATGIVRRIDELGRVVIPKEIRRTLRIREGDPLEIFTDREGEIILKKYSPIGELGEFAKEFTGSMHHVLGHICAICDKDVIITVAGGSRRELSEKRVHEDVENLMHTRGKVLASASRGEKLLHVTAEEEDFIYKSQVIVPILAEGDAIGAILVLSREPDAGFSEVEFKVAETAAGFIGRQMEQ